MDGIDWFIPEVYLIGVITGMILAHLLLQYRKTKRKAGSVAHLRIMLDVDAEFFDWLTEEGERTVFVFPSGSWDLSEAQRANLKRRVRECIRQVEESTR